LIKPIIHHIFFFLKNLYKNDYEKLFCETIHYHFPAQKSWLLLQIFKMLKKLAKLLTSKLVFLPYES